jgi:NADPH2:quinone reductase
MEYKRIKISEFGGLDVLKLVTEKALPEPANGQVRIRVLTTSAAFTDTLIRRGIYPDVKKKDLPLSPGYDLIGVVDKLGEGVTDLKVGQKVAELTVIGAYSEYICLNAQTLVPVPDDVDNAEAVSLILTYVTAYQMLHHVANVQKGQTILIHAAAGAVGTALLQLGKLMDLKMYGTASTAKKEYVENLGGIPIDYKKEDFLSRLQKDEPNGIDAVFDPMGGDYFPRSLKTLKKKGILVGFGFQNAASGKSGNMIIDFFKIMIWNLLPTKPRAKFYLIGDWHKKQNNAFKEDLMLLFGLLKQGKIKPVIAKRMKLEEAAEAQRLVEEAKIEGKIILTMNEEQVKS